MPLTLQQAKTVIAAAETQSNLLGVQSSIAVVDVGGNLVAFVAQDGATLVTHNLAIGKAYTALALHEATSSLSAQVIPGAEFYGLAIAHSSRPLVTFAGGQPLGDPIFGGVGVSGGTAAQDEEISLAAAATFRLPLEFT